MSTEPPAKFKLLQCSVEGIVPALEAADQHGYRLLCMTQEGATYTLVFELKATEPSTPVKR